MDEKLILANMVGKVIDQIMEYQTFLPNLGISRKSKTKKNSPAYKITKPVPKIIFEGKNRNPPSLIGPKQKLKLSQL